MVNDLLSECYLLITVRHQVISLDGVLTFDKHPLSKVFDFGRQISESAVIGRAFEPPRA
jgi:hypothetical protein